MLNCEAAVAIVHARQPEESVLLMRRTEREGDPWSGHWSFPGGRCEAHDEGALQTALRELNEECGICLDPRGPRVALEFAVARRKVGRFLNVAPFVFPVDAQLETVPAPDEATECRWMPLRRVTDPAEHRLLPIPGMPATRLFPAIELDHMPLWGFTYRLLTEWLALLPEDREEAGASAAGRLLDYLRAFGMKVVESWKGRAATVEGPIPVDHVCAYLAAPGDRVPPVNAVEVRRDAIHVLGLGFEEYVIATR
jgi:8-oxo-dGTP pyrophosphatase MutT (NUDIX family)